MPVWLKLIRPPNLFSIPGDVVAGFAIAGGFANFANQHYWQLPLLILSSLLLYVGGLLLNDYADRDVDAAERPDRPIPSGAVSAPTVRNAAIVTNGLAIALAAAASLPGAAVAAALALCASAYNLGAKKRPLLGIPTMAACRTLNILLGAVLVGSSVASRALPAAILSGVFIIVVCLVAKDEAERVPAKWIPPLIPIVVALALLPGLPGFNLPGIKCLGVWVAAGLLVGAAIATTRAIMTATKPQQIPPQVGSLIRMLILMQAYWTAAAGAPCIIVALILACWPAARIIGRWFYAS